jgi:Fuc2NAc and GlcNAc transferase
MIYLLIITFLCSFVLTGIYRRYALAKNILDVPNHRSAHCIPTPRGGGLAFVMVVLIATPVLWYLGFESGTLGTVLCLAGLFITALGFLDDRGHLSTPSRLIGHVIASAFVLYGLGGMPPVAVLGWILPMGWLLNGFAMIYLVWLLNLYNFMDGINGLAAIEAISVCFSGAFIYGFHGDHMLLGLPLVVLTAVAGFLWWNFPSARLFMGDTGSTFLGLVFGLLSIQAAWVKPHFFWVWLILLGVFIVDATVTLLCRLCLGVKVYQAHCDHAYQHAAQRCGSHALITLSVLMINLFWLLPIANWVDQASINGVIGLCIAYTPLIILAFFLRAGRTKNNSVNMPVHPD